MSLNISEKIERWSKQNKKQVTLNQFKSVEDYIRHVVGVDKIDWITNKYRIKIEQKMLESNFREN